MKACHASRRPGSAAITRSRTDSSNWRLRRTRWPPHSTATPLSDGGSASPASTAAGRRRTMGRWHALPAGAANTGRGGSPDDVPGRIAAWIGRRRTAWTTPRARILLVYSWQSPWLVVELPFNLIDIPGPVKGSEWTLTYQVMRIAVTHLPHEGIQRRVGFLRCHI